MATITKIQIRTHCATVGTHLDYFRRLRECMQAIGFHHQDRLLLAVREAEDALRGLWIRLHYAGCESGVGVRSAPELENAAMTDPPGSRISPTTPR